MLDPQNYTGTYKVIAGKLCLDFANTVSWRNHTKEHDWLHDIFNYIEWGEMVGILSQAQVDTLRQRAENDPTNAQVVLTKVKELREAINRIFSCLSDHTKPEGEDIKLFNKFLPTTLRHLYIEAEGLQFGWRWANQPGNLESAIWPVVWSAANLLISNEKEWLGTCGECGWLFIDTSRNHSRRWCTMEDCGNRAKVRRHRKRNDT